VIVSVQSQGETYPLIEMVRGAICLSKWVTFLSPLSRTIAHLKPLVKNYFTTMKRFFLQSLFFSVSIPAMREKLLRKLIADIDLRGMKTIACESGVSIPTLWRIVNDKFLGSMATWEKLNTYYKRSRQ